MKKRIVVTGYGAITPIGNTVPQLLESLKQGKGGVGPITSIKCDDFPTQYAAEVKDFDPLHFLEKKDIRKMDRFAHLAIASAKEAVSCAQLDLSSLDPYRTGAIFGVGIGGMSSYETSLINLYNHGWKRVPVMTIPRIISNSASANIAMQYGSICGPNYAVTTACASGSDAIGAAVRHLMLGETDVVLAGGAEASVTRYGIASFNVLHALSTKYNDTPEVASRPFDKDRDGFVMGEGAATLILETLEHAHARGAKIYGEFAGYGSTCDAYHYTSPHPEGEKAVAAMSMALKQANVQPSAIDYINAHGTSTPTNDPIETKVIKKVFQEHAYEVKISSTKSMTGHCIGAAGAIEAVISLLAVEHGVIPPTINLENPDPECDLNYVPHDALYQEVHYAMSNTLGFGGHNSVLIFKKYTP